MIGDSIDIILITSLNYLGLSRYPCFKTVLNWVGKIRALIFPTQFNTVLNWVGKIRALIYFLYSFLLHILYSTHIGP